MIIVNKAADKTKKIVDAKILELESKFHQPIEPLILTMDDFLATVNSSERGIIYGLAEGCEVLTDKTNGELTKVLHNRIKEIMDTHEYLKEEEIWVK